MSAVASDVRFGYAMAEEKERLRIEKNRARERARRARAQRDLWKARYEDEREARVEAEKRVAGLESILRTVDDEIKGVL